MTDTQCGSAKVQGSEKIHCHLAPGHDLGDNATWHEAIVTDERHMDFGACRIDVHTREAISWEPFADTLKCAVSPLDLDTP